MSAEYSQGICQDGAAILKDGQMMTVEEIVSELNGPDWIDMKERQPPIFSTVLGWNARANQAYPANTCRIFCAALENTCDITHWMPLPEPPK